MLTDHRQQEILNLLIGWPNAHGQDAKTHGSLAMRFAETTFDEGIFSSNPTACLQLA